MSRWIEILKQAERDLIELLSEESENVVHSIETELESLLHANFPADFVTERNRLEKFGEKTKQILEEKRKHKWKKFTGINKNSRTATHEYSNHFNFVNFSDREKRKLMRSTNDSQPEVNQETEAAVTLEPKKNDYSVSQNSTESTLPKTISREDAQFSSDPVLANNSANPDKVLNETANQRQDDRRQHSTDEENNIKNDEGNQFGEKVVYSGKYCSVISPKNVSRVS